VKLVIKRPSSVRSIKRASNKHSVQRLSLLTQRTVSRVEFNARHSRCNFNGKSAHVAAGDVFHGFETRSTICAGTRDLIMTPRYLDMPPRNQPRCFSGSEMLGPQTLFVTIRL